MIELTAFDNWHYVNKYTIKESSIIGYSVHYNEHDKWYSVYFNNQQYTVNKDTYDKLEKYFKEKK